MVAQVGDWPAVYWKTDGGEKVRYNMGSITVKDGLAEGSKEII